jgi:hypothetical protein
MLQAFGYQSLRVQFFGQMVRTEKGLNLLWVEWAYLLEQGVSLDTILLEGRLAKENCEEKDS